MIVRRRAIAAEAQVAIGASQVATTLALGASRRILAKISAAKKRLSLVGKQLVVDLSSIRIQSCFKLLPIGCLFFARGEFNEF